MCTVVVAGAGPAGLRTAALLAKQGWEVTVFEEHAQVGIPENCSGLFSVSGLKELGIDASACTVNEIYGADIFSPSGERLTIEKNEPVAVVVKRSEFDKMLFEEAIKNGAQVELNSKLIDVRQENIFFQRGKRGELRKAKIVVGADGVLSTAREIAGITVDKRFFLQSYQERVQGSFERKKVKVYLGSFAPGFFAWVIPECENIARIGIATLLGINAKDAFENFKKRLMIEFETIEAKSFMIACGPPLEEPCIKNILLVGSAAFQAKASTGGGVIIGLNAAEKCAHAIAAHLRGEAKLDEYVKMLKPINKDLWTHWKLRSYLNSLSDASIDKLIAKANRLGLGEFLSEHGDMDWPSRFIGQAMRKPRFWGMLPLLLRLR